MEQSPRATRGKYVSLGVSNTVREGRESRTDKKIRRVILGLGCVSEIEAATRVGDGTKSMRII